MECCGRRHGSRLPSPMTMAADADPLISSPPLSPETVAGVRGLFEHSPSASRGRCQRQKRLVAGRVLSASCADFVLRKAGPAGIARGMKHAVRGAVLRRLLVLRVRHALCAAPGAILSKGLHRAGPTSVFGPASAVLLAPSARAATTASCRRSGVARARAVSVRNLVARYPFRVAGHDVSR